MNENHDSKTGEFTSAGGASAPEPKTALHEHGAVVDHPDATLNAHVVHDKIQDPHVYHGAPGDAMASIVEHGLRPNEYGNPLNFAHNKALAQDYADIGSGHVMRVLRSDLPRNTTHDSMTGRSWTKSPVPPGKIEIRRGNKWEALVRPGSK